jgi:hypothetical protein
LNDTWAIQVLKKKSSTINNGMVEVIERGNKTFVASTDKIHITILEIEK